jgi:cobalt-zinc-cadmium resistance protein CzcA
LLEKTTAETQTNEMQNLLRQNEADLRIAEYQLQTLMFAESPVTSVDEELTERPLNLNADSTDINSNPGMSFYKQQIEIAERKKNVEVAKALPDFLLGYFNQTLIGYQNVNNQDVYFGSNKRFQGFQVGLGIPLWYAPHASRIRAMRYVKAEESANFEAYKTNLQNQLTQAKETYLKNKDNIAYYRTSAKPNADLIINQTQKAFQQGDISYAEHLLNLRQAIAIQVNYLEALNNYNQSVIYLEYLIGIR